MPSSDPATIRVPHPFQRSHRWKGWGIGASRPSQHANPRHSSTWSHALLTLAASLILATATQAQSPTLTNDPAHPATTQNWVDTKLYFGLGPANAPQKGISEAKWRAFLDQEVTPRFPAGLSVIDVYGQWLSKSAQTTPNPHPERIRSKLLIIDYPATPGNEAKIEAIRVAWKRLTGDQSVLKVTQPADVSF
jgi:hypothetical protein